jgi:hypothetical protein
VRVSAQSIGFGTGSILYWLLTTINKLKIHNIAVLWAFLTHSSEITFEGMLAHSDEGKRGICSGYGGCP